MYPDKVKKYLERNPLFTHYPLVRKDDLLYKGICVIPSLAEFENLPKLLTSLEANSSSLIERTLFVFVVNNTLSASEEVKADNEKSISFLKDYSSNLHINIIDASSNGNELNDKEGGVGLARKIGMDYALTKFDYKKSENNFIICLDSDCKVSTNYLESIYNAFKLPSTKAAYINFEHKLSGNDLIDRAIINYEIFLRYYILGLQYSKSPYAFHTIGSTMICDYESYITIGGMNKRKAGEDFYFMEKLAKNFKIHKLNNAKVFPSPRPSFRVPFGTGQRVKRFIEQSRNEYLLYHPDSFSVLKKWNELFFDEHNLSAEEYLNNSRMISETLYNFLIENSFEKNWNNIRTNCKTSEQLRKQKVFWFDGFRTLKLIHYLRDFEFPEMDTFTAVNELLRMNNLNVFPNISKESPIEEQIKILNYLRKIA